MVAGAHGNLSGCAVTACRAALLESLDWDALVCFSAAAWKLEIYVTDSVSFKQHGVI